MFNRFILLVACLLPETILFKCCLLCCCGSVLRIRSSTYYPKWGFGAFGAIPLLMKKRCIFNQSNNLIWIPQLVCTNTCDLQDECLLTSLMCFAEYLLKIMVSWDWDMELEICLLGPCLCPLQVCDLNLCNWISVSWTFGYWSLGSVGYSYCAIIAVVGL